MGLGKITRGLGKVGLALEALGYVIAGGKAVVKVIKGKGSDDQRAAAGQGDDGVNDPAAPQVAERSA